MDSCFFLLFIRLFCSMMTPAQQYKAAVSSSNNCLYLVRQFRNLTLKTYQQISEQMGSSSRPTNQQIQKCVNLLDRLKLEFEKLEAHSKSLPSQMPRTDKLETMINLYQEEQLDTGAHDLIAAMADCSNWNEGNFQMYSFLHDFQKHQYRRKPSVFVPRPVAYSDWRSIHPHNHFEGLFAHTVKEFAAKRVGIYHRYLEKNNMSSIIELRFGVYVEKQTVCSLKMIMVENNGQIEMVQFIAPHEEWGFTEEMGERRVDLTRESRYLVFRKLSVQGNLHLYQSINPNVDYRSHSSLMQICILFSKFQQIFEAQCRSCKKVMRDYLPPLIFDCRSPKQAALHEICK